MRAHADADDGELGDVVVGGDLAAAEARQRTASNGVRDTKITAPFSGTIEKRLVQDGETTPRGTQLFTMVRTATLELAGSLPARSADDVL